MADELHTEIAVIKATIQGMEHARQLQAAEYARRLDELNHAHAKAEQRNAEYLPRELFDTKMRQVENWQHDIDGQLAQTKGGKAVVVAVVSVLFSVLALLMAMLRLMKV